MDEDTYWSSNSWKSPSNRIGTYRSCRSCWNRKEGGWNAPNGQYYCKACWDKILYDVDSSAVGSTSTGEDTNPDSTSTDEDTSLLCSPVKTSERTTPDSARSKFARLCRRPCFRSCCAPRRPRSILQLWEEDEWKLEDNEVDTVSEPNNVDYWECDISKLNGLNYSDAHCHLDTFLQNLKHDGPGWDAKQKMCQWWLEDQCPYGHDCCFAHGEDELIQRVPLTVENVEPWLAEIAQSPDGSTDKPVCQCLITNCCEIASIPDTKLLMDIAERTLGGNGKIFCTFGCHPHDYREWGAEMEQRLLEGLEACRDRVVAWGECGLDYCKNYWTCDDPLEKRRMFDVFVRQIQIAVERRLPLVVHARDAEEDTLKIVEEHMPRDLKAHLHSHQGSVFMMNEWLRLLPNSVVGVGGMVLNGNEGAIETARHCPLHRLVLETDAPYLANSSLDIPRLAIKVAELKGISAAQVMEVTSANCERFYNINCR